MKPLTAACIALGLGVPGVAASQVALTPIARIDSSAIAYITQNGSVVSRLAESNPDRLIGRAVPCRSGADATYTLAPTAAYPLPETSRYVADASARVEPLMILTQATISGQLGVGPLSVEANSDQLTRLDISEAVRLSINTGEGNSALGASSIIRLNSLSGTMPTGYGHWCVITSASVWNIRYETYRRAGGVPILGQGFWIVTASGRYSRNASSVVPYQVVTIGFTPYAASWVTAQASSLLATGSGTVVAPPSLVASAVRGEVTIEAIARGDAVNDILSSADRLRQ